MKWLPFHDNWKSVFPNTALWNCWRTEGFCMFHSQGPDLVIKIFLFHLFTVLWILFYCVVFSYYWNKCLTRFLLYIYFHAYLIKSNKLCCLPGILRTASLCSFLFYLWMLGWTYLPSNCVFFPWRITFMLLF